MIDLEALKARALAVGRADDGGQLLRRAFSDLRIARQELREIEEILNDSGSEWIRQHGEVDLGEGRKLGFSYSWETTHTDRYGTIEMLLDAVETIVPEGGSEIRGALVEILDDVLPKSKSGPWLKTGLEKHGIDTGPLYTKQKRVGSDGEPVRRLVVKDDKYRQKKETTS